ncbi:hypothetical protein [Halomonas denitrificans]|uniref:COG3904 family protein n=1 Tax=Halomonas denitrificans TaxID=370769 RepID=UPI00130051B7|nr:hypothetical protein [Halomonas denitrificans]
MRSKVFSRCLAFTLVVLAGQAIGQDNSIKVYPPDDLYTKVTGNPRLGTLFITGEITTDLAGEIAKIVEDLRLDGGSVVLNSPGGNLLAGIELGQVIRSSGLSTNVGRDGGSPVDKLPGQCFSSCVMAYVGGLFRTLEEGSKLGVHRFSSEVKSDSDLDVAQILSAAITNHLTAMGVSSELFERMVMASKDEIYVLGREESQSLNLVTGGSMIPEWSMEIVEGGYYLRGSQDSWWGEGRNMLLCVDDNILLTTMYQAGANASTILESTVKHSLRVDGEFIDLGNPLKWEVAGGSYVTGLFRLDAYLKMRIQSSESFGHAAHPHNPEIFWGYTVETKGGKQMIRDFMSNCR